MTIATAIADAPVEEARGCGKRRKNRSGRKGGFFRNGWEIAAMVVAFVLFWPAGLALLAYYAWRPDMSTLTNGWKSGARRALADIAPGLARETSGTGNHAFDAYRAEVLERLEAERRKLEEDERAFADFVEELRRQKDREAFDRFMASRRAGGEIAG